MEFCKCIFRSLKSSKSGFTLIEFLVTLGVLAIVATVTIALINPQLQLKKANDGRRKSDLLKIQSALELYRSNESYYPPVISLLTSGTPKYLQALPNDPNGSGYGYTVFPSGCDNSVLFCTTYELWACLEYDDKDADVNRNPPGPEQCSGDSKSYTVTSP